MGMKITYAGKDITDKISVNQCIHDMYAEDRSDTLLLRVNDVSGIWDTWQPKTGDEVSVTYGAVGTGKMFVNECRPVNGIYTIKATSVPVTYRSKYNKAWQNVRLLQIGQEIAARHGLSFQSYGVTDYLYNYILQENQGDFAFLNWRCILEGYAITVYDGVLNMYSQSYMENQNPAEYLDLSIDADYRYSDRSSSGFGSCEIERGGYSGSYTANNGLSAVYRPTEPVWMGSSDEAARYAKNLLRNVNKNCKSGFIRGYVMPGYAAGSVAVIKNPRAPSWDGNVFLTHVRNDYGECNSKIFFRKPLEGY